MHKKIIILLVFILFFSTSIPFSIGLQNLEKPYASNSEYNLTMELTTTVTPSSLEWPLFRHDPMHTGFTEGIGCIEYPIEKWHFNTGFWVVSSPALGDINGDGNVEVVVGSCDDYVYALNGMTGVELWSFKTGRSVDSSPALGDIDGDGNVEVVVGSLDSNVYALNGMTGVELWSFKTGSYVGSSPALGDIDGDGDVEVVVGSSDKKIYAIDNDEKPPFVDIVKPSEGFVYVFNEQYDGIPSITFIFGEITVQVNASDADSGMQYVQFFIDDTLKASRDAPAGSGYYEWTWVEPIPVFGSHIHTIKVCAVDKLGNEALDEITVWIWNLLL